ncbi:MAG: flagellar hook protein FlgE [Deltaproteobacteria bacterium]|nr:flagellar hook protein FlgE [Deltaproteobacteria bacterium]
MRLFTGLIIGRESLMTHGSALSTVADNLSNANTPGFKAQRSEFSDLFASSIGAMFSDPLTSGSGVSVDDISTLYTQGSIEQTDRELDMAISGRGFFVVNDGANDYYTRAGNFQVDADGNLITIQGDSVMGFTEASPDTAVALNLVDLNSSAAPSTAISLSGNLDAESAMVTAAADPATFIELNAASTFNSSVEVVDSLGVRHDVALHFFHTEALGWEVQAYVDGEATGGVAGTPALLGTSTITFEPNGVQAEGAGASISLSPSWANQSEATTVAIDLSGFTQYGFPSSLNSVVNDGVVAGSLVGVNVDAEGVISGIFDNGENEVVGTLALAMFNSEDGLVRVGDNKFGVSETSGIAEVAAARTDGRGSVAGQSLEQANVDTANEFIDMIRYQRGYQAGSKIISTIDTLLDRTLQIA